MRIGEFTQSPFISYENKNMVYIKTEDWDYCNPFQAEVKINGEIVSKEKIFAAEFSLMLPTYETEEICNIKIIPFEDLPVERNFILKPQKNLTISLIYSSHEDLGYCAYIDKLHFESYEYLKKAMELCEKYEGFKYMIEHYWWFDAFDHYASDEEKARLKQLFEERKIELNGIHSGVHTSWGNAEQLVRELYFSLIEAKNKYGIKPEFTIYTDISGISWSAVNARSNMGIKYMGALANGWRCGEKNKNIPPLFWWGDKSGENKVLFWYQRSYRPNGLTEIWCDTKRQYPEGEFFFDTTKAKKTERWITENFKDLYDYGFENFPLSFYDDREEPTTMLLTVCEEMNKRWKSPHFNMDVPSAVLEKAARECGDKLPLYRGEITDQWSDYATIAPNMTRKKRDAMRKLYDAEVLSLVKGIKNNVPYNTKSFSDAIFNMCMFDEHCWASSSKHPQAMHRYNIEKVKKDSAENADKELSEILNSLCGKPDENGITLVNTVPLKRNSSLRTDSTALIPADIAHQILPDGTVITDKIAFDGIESKNFKSAAPYKESILTEIDSFETDFYKVKLNRTTQKIVSIIDKESGFELVDSESKFELGQFVYMYSEHKEKPDSGFEVPKRCGFEVYEGELAYIIIQKGYEEQSAAETLSQFIFYKKEKNIDIDLSFKNAVGLLGDYYDRFKKNYFFALPFNLNDPEFFTEMHAGEKNENTETLPLNASDFTVTQNYVAAENEYFGCAVYTRDMPVFHLGSIKYNRFGKEFKENKGHFYLYASSNRCNNLIYSSIEECRAEYRLSVLTYSGNRSKTVPLWSNLKEHSILIGGKDIGDIGSIKLSKNNLRLVSLKKAERNENAVIMRFTETEGLNNECEVSLFFEPTEAYYASNDELNREKIKVSGNRIRFKTSPYSYTTLKIYGDFVIKEIT